MKLTSKTAVWFVLLIGAVCMPGYADAPAGEPKLAYAVPTPGPDGSEFGAHVQRTMKLLATSTPQHRNHVKILIYGQSISEGNWWHYVDHNIRTRFPNADLELINRALGGHASNYLVREAETDVYPYYPDLILFHVYGAHTCYEQIISRMRSRTTAEVLITTDHLAADEVLNSKGQFENMGWTKFMAVFIPQVAHYYGCELVDVRPPWKQYLIANHLKAQSMLQDGIHLGPQGNALYSALIERQLVYKPAMKDIDAKDVRTYDIGKDIHWKDGKLVLEFQGNRIDAIAGPDGGKGTGASVEIDGKKPSELIGCYAFTRDIGPGLKIMCVSSIKTPLVEDWTVRVIDVDRAQKSFTFEAIGSKTGPDGKGVSTQKFISNSGRIVIETAVEKPYMGIESDFAFDINNIAPGAEVKFQCYALHADHYAAPIIADPTREYSVTLGQGFENGKHTLTLAADDAGKVAIKSLRVYCPPVPVTTPLIYVTGNVPKER